jgi:hypothetical protein
MESSLENILVISVYGLFQVKELRIFAPYRSKHDLDLLRSSVFKAGVFSRNEKKHMFIEVRLSYVPDSLWSNTANGRSVFHINDTFNQPLIAKQLAASNASSVDSTDFRNILRGTYLERIESECISLLKQYSLPELQRELADLKDGSISFPSKWLFTSTDDWLFPGNRYSMQCILGDKAMNRKPHFSDRKADLLSRL